jgi:hypothetical protein
MKEEKKNSYFFIKFEQHSIANLAPSFDPLFPFLHDIQPSLLVLKRKKREIKAGRIKRPHTKQSKVHSPSSHFSALAFSMALERKKGRKEKREKKKRLQKKKETKSFTHSCKFAQPLL